MGPEIPSGIYPENFAGIPPEIKAGVHMKIPLVFPSDIPTCITPEIIWHLLLE